jgi:hypothetical protein
MLLREGRFENREVLRTHHLQADVGKTLLDLRELPPKLIARRGLVIGDRDDDARRGQRECREQSEQLGEPVPHGNSMPALGPAGVVW